MLNKNCGLFLSIILLMILLSCSSGSGQSPMMKLDEAKEKIANKKYEDAKNITMQIIDENPNMLEAHQLLIKSFHLLNQIEGAIEYYNKKNDTIIYFWSEEKAPFLFGLGYSYMISGRYAKATEYFNDSISLAPHSAFAEEINRLSTTKEGSELRIEVPTRSTAETVRLAGIGAGVFIILIVLIMVYNAYKDRKKGELQAQKIEKDRAIDFFGKPRKKERRKRE